MERANRALGALLLTAATLASCATSTQEAGRSGEPDDPVTAARRAMVDRQIRARGVRDPLVLAAMERVPRHLFVPEEIAAAAYGDHPLLIGHGQTISQPYIVALMTELAELTGGETVLEVGTGSGYQAAVLAEIVERVFTIEIVEPLAATATERLDRLGYDNVVVRYGDGYRGWPEHAPFDAILVTAAPDHVPEPLIEQLAVGGRLVLPVGEHAQDLVQITKSASGVVRRDVIPVRFVPMTGEAEGKEPGGGRE